MRSIILAALLTAAPVAAAADETAIRGVIDDQIAAFEADDFDGAFAYAAPNIRSLFGSPSNFGRMVRDGYPMVWRPGSVEYLGADDRGRLWDQDVMITDDAGRLHRLRYSMVRTPDGWRIAGVRILAEPEVGA
ncbi:DUF4864 domain-containing protein [Jannaschia sp. LMIT008]|uniref:DUF4864 domain-containing protein n=1 Tax=Jannaschia maritima TaxID=3032585 RepID=UPI00281283A3|nr:DUF4864 domain-containing protein [Jannaschia sp. LMIT008]